MDCNKGKKSNGVLLFIVILFICVEVPYIRPSHRTATVDSPFKYKNNVYGTRFLMEELSPNNSLTTRPTRPRRTDSICNNATLMPGGTMPVIALASLPGSGNTWCRYLIESVTGVYTGSVYTDKNLLRGGFLGEAAQPYSGKTVAVKMHKMEFPEKIDRTILLVRDFYDASIAEFNRAQAGKKRNKKEELKPDGHTYVLDSSAYTNTKDLYRVVTKWTQTWLKMIRVIAGNFSKNDRLLVVYFDDLKTDLDRQLRRIVDFLGLPLDKERLICTLHNAEGKFHRPQHDLSINPFTEEMTDKIKSTVQSAQTTMMNHGLSPLWINATSLKFSL